MPYRLLTAFLLAAALLTACPAVPPPPNDDAGSDSGNDTSLDTPPDLESDPEDDPATDAVDDTQTDSHDDVVSDAGEDAASAPDATTDPDTISADPDASSPEWPSCSDGSGTVETLAEKAAFYDDLAVRLHLHPELRFIATVELPTTTAPCEDDPEETCTVPAVPLAEATWEDVVHFRNSPNDGLWNALYMTSQAYRYAVTGEEEVLETLRVLMAGERDRMAITGVPGVFTRRLLPPDLPESACPTDDASYTADIEKDDDRWVRVDGDGCVEYVDPETLEWTTSDHCGLEEYAGWCWYDNVSQDEYVGHIYALGAILQLVDDEGLRADATDLLLQVGRHLMENDLQFIDWDGRLTEHGAIFTPELAVSFVATAAYGTGDEELIAWFESCLEGTNVDRCIPWLPQFVFPLTEHFALISPFVGRDGCESNWNGFSMALASYQNIVWFSPDASARARAREAFDSTLFRADNARALLHERNPWYTYVWASVMPFGPWNEDARAAMEDARCAMERFPATREQIGLDNLTGAEPVCISRLDDPYAADPFPPEQRCPTHFLWWFPPYEYERCEARPWVVYHPSDYLLSYWMGRYHGYL